MAELKIIKQDTEGYVCALLGILSAPAEVFEGNLKVSAATNLKSLLNKLNRKGEILLETRFLYGEKIYAVMCCDHIENRVRTMLSYALYPVLSGNAPTETIPHFSEIIAKNMMTGLYPMTASLQAIRGFFSGQTTDDCIEEYARTLIEGLGELANAFVK